MNIAFSTGLGESDNRISSLASDPGRAGQRVWGDV